MNGFVYMMGFFASIIALGIVPHTSNLDNYQFPKIKGYQKEGEATAVGGSGNEHAEEKHTFGLVPVWVYVCEREREREPGEASTMEIGGGSIWWSWRSRWDLVMVVFMGGWLSR